MDRKLLTGRTEACTNKRNWLLYLKRIYKKQLHSLRTKCGITILKQARYIFYLVYLVGILYKIDSYPTWHFLLRTGWGWALLKRAKSIIKHDKTKKSMVSVKLMIKISKSHQLKIAVSSRENWIMTLGAITTISNLKILAAF